MITRDLLITDFKRIVTSIYLDKIKSFKLFKEFFKKSNPVEVFFLQQFFFLIDLNTEEIIDIIDFVILHFDQEEILKIAVNDENIQLDDPYFLFYMELCLTYYFLLMTLREHLPNFELGTMIFNLRINKLSELPKPRKEMGKDVEEMIATWLYYNKFRKNMIISDFDLMKSKILEMEKELVKMLIYFTLNQD